MARRRSLRIYEIKAAVGLVVLLVASVGTGLNRPTSSPPPSEPTPAPATMQSPATLPSPEPLPIPEPDPVASEDPNDPAESSLDPLSPHVAGYPVADPATPRRSNPGRSSGACAGSMSCSACTDCSRCKHCHRDGGQCGACGAPAAATREAPAVVAGAFAPRPVAPVLGGEDPANVAAFLPPKRPVPAGRRGMAAPGRPGMPRLSPRDLARRPMLGPPPGLAAPGPAAFALMEAFRVEFTGDRAAAACAYQAVIDAHPATMEAGIARDQLEVLKDAPAGGTVVKSPIVPKR